MYMKTVGVEKRSLEWLEKVFSLEFFCEGEELLRRVIFFILDTTSFSLFSDCCRVLQHPRCICILTNKFSFTSTFEGTSSIDRSSFIESTFDFLHFKVFI